MKFPELSFVKEGGIILLVVLVDALAQFPVFVCVHWDCRVGDFISVLHNSTHGLMVCRVA